MQGIADEKAAAKADARAATASAREAGLGSERDKAFEALKQENERLRDALTSVMRQVEGVVVHFCLGCEGGPGVAETCSTRVL
eukprot:scaffold9519_cov54-Phaeocystis_antarctica.AAC.1